MHTPWGARRSVNTIGAFWVMVALTTVIAVEAAKREKVPRSSTALGSMQGTMKLNLVRSVGEYATWPSATLVSPPNLDNIPHSTGMQAGTHPA